MMDSLPMAAAAPVLAITESAAAQFERMRAKRQKPEAVLRVRVVPDSGCGDFRYAMGIEPGPRDGDMSIDAHGITVIVDPASVGLLRGSTLVDQAGEVVAMLIFCAVGFFAATRLFTKKLD